MSLTFVFMAISDRWLETDSEI